MFVVQVLAIAFLQLYFVEETSGTIRVTLSVFSGVPDPAWLLEPTKDLLQDYVQAGKENKLFKVDAMPSRLGYRGFIIEEGKKEVLVLGPDTKRLQHKLLMTMPASAIPVKVLKRVYADIESGSILAGGKKTRRKRALPQFSPVQRMFADAGTRRKNNCYNYANIKVTNTFAQPGKGGGAMYKAITKARIVAAARKDRLISADRDDIPDQDNPRHLVALAVEDCVDFHWYLKNADGKWSHKPGRTKVTRLDNAGQEIDDPANCDMNGYEFVGYMLTNKDTALIA